VGRVFSRSVLVSVHTPLSLLGLTLNGGEYLFMSQRRVEATVTMHLGICLGAAIGVPVERPFSRFGRL